MISKITKLAKISSVLGNAVLSATLMLSASPAAYAGELTVYTAIEAEDLKKYAAKFNEDHPDITVKWVRDSTGIVTAKLLAEKDNIRLLTLAGLYKKYNLVNGQALVAVKVYGDMP